MNKRVMTTLLVGSLLGAASAAWGQGWSSFEAAFPSNPCHDGWMGCVVDGQRLDPELTPAGDALPSPSDLRVAWHDLTPTAAFSPFVGLSTYTGGAAVAAVAVDDGDEPETPTDGDDGVAEAGGARQADEAAEAAATEAAARRAASNEAARQARVAEQARREAEAEARRVRKEQAAMQRQAEQAAAAAASAAAASEAAEQDRLQREADDAAQRAAAAQAARQAADEAARQAADEEARRQAAAAEEDRLQQQAEAARLAAEDEARRAAEDERRQKEEEAARIAQQEAERQAADAARVAAEQAAAAAAAAATSQAATDAGTATDGGDGVAVAELPNPPPAMSDGSCDDILAMEPTAMLGKLDEGQTGCLEAKLSTATKMTDKEKISRVLMVNAYTKGDKKSWEGLVRRHLDEIDQSDPDLCYKYVLHLSRMGPGRASGVIRWASVALENRTVWTGETYTSRVYSLFKHRAAASQALWMAAEDDHASAPSDETSGKVEKYRAMTKVHAREWLEYAKDAGKDASVALQLCTSAAGTADYCEAG